MLHFIHKFLIFFFTDGFRERSCLEAFGMLFILLVALIFDHFFEALIADAVGVVG